MFKKLYNYLVLKEFKSKFLNDKIKLGIISFFNYFFYPEFRKKYGFFKLVKSNVYIVILIFIIISSYFTAYFIQNNKIKKLYDIVNIFIYKSQLQNDTILNLKDSLNTQCRNYIEHIVIEDTKIGHSEDFKNLPDSIFFTMFYSCVKYRIPYTIFYRIIDHESGFLFVKNYDGSGATGYMQLMPQTFDELSNELKLKGGNTPVNNIIVGGYYLKISHDYWSMKYKSEKEAWMWTLAEYRVGRGGLQDTIKTSDTTFILKYNIPNDIKPYIDHEMMYYDENVFFDISKK